jgi:excisionase family DNA binding protein
MSKKLVLLPKQVAADLLSLSVRRLMELSEHGKFTRHRAFDPETKREACMFDAAEIQAAQESREYDARPAPVPSAAVAVQSRTAAVAVRPRLPLDEYDIDAPAVLRPWLTLAEAAAYSGLPASYLRELIGTLELKARNVGPRPGGRWRVRRLDLDAIAGVSVLIPL